MVLCFLCALNVLTVDFKYIQRNMQYPAHDRIVSADERSTVKMMVNESGNISTKNSTLLHKIRYGISGEKFLIMVESSNDSSDIAIVSKLNDYVNAYSKNKSGKWVLAKVINAKTIDSSLLTKINSVHARDYIGHLYNLEAYRGFRYVEALTDRDVDIIQNERNEQKIGESINKTCKYKTVQQILARNKVQCTRIVEIELDNDKRITSCTISLNSDDNSYVSKTTRKYYYTSNNKIYDKQVVESDHIYKGNKIWDSKTESTYRYEEWSDSSVREIIKSTTGIIDPIDKQDNAIFPWYLIMSICGILLIVSVIVYSVYSNKHSSEGGVKNAAVRPGFTLVEMLVVIGVLFMLVGLMMPAIQKVRAAADRIVCASRLRQLGIALHNYHNDYQALPSGLSSNRPSNPYPNLGWQPRLLPYLEQDATWNQIVASFRIDRWPFNNPPHDYFSKPIKLFACPSDERISQAQPTRMGLVVGLTSYVGVLGTSWNQPDGCLFVDSRVRLTDIHDGTTNTICIGERPPSPDFWFGWWYASAGRDGTGSPDILLGGNENNQGGYIGGCPTGPYAFAPGKLDNMCDVFHFWSLHPGGAHFLMGDASVHFLKYSAAPLIPDLCTRNGGEPVQLPE